MPEVCPEARGFVPEELTCWARLSRDRHAGVGWFRRLWRTLTGYYGCPYEGRLPCPRSRDVTDEAL